MTALGSHVAGTFASGFALLADLRQLAPAEHAELVRRMLGQLAAITEAEQARRAPNGPAMSVPITADVGLVRWMRVHGVRLIAMILQGGERDLAHELCGLLGIEMPKLVAGARAEQARRRAAKEPR